MQAMFRELLCDVDRKVGCGNALEARRPPHTIYPQGSKCGHVIGQRCVRWDFVRGGNVGGPVTKLVEGLADQFRNSGNRNRGAERSRLNL